MRGVYWVNCPQCGWRKMPRNAFVCLTCQERISEYNRRMKGLKNPRASRTRIDLENAIANS